MLNVDSTGARPREIADEFFARRRIVKRILPDKREEGFGLWPFPRGFWLLDVLLCLPGEDDLPSYQAIFSEHFSTGVFNLRRMDSLMPGIDSR